MFSYKIVFVFRNLENYGSIQKNIKISHNPRNAEITTLNVLPHVYIFFKGKKCRFFLLSWIWCWHLGAAGHWRRPLSLGGTCQALLGHPRDSLLHWLVPLLIPPGPFPLVCTAHFHPRFKPSVSGGGWWGNMEGPSQPRHPQGAFCQERGLEEKHVTAFHSRLPAAPGRCLVLGDPWWGDFGILWESLVGAEGG